MMIYDYIIVGSGHASITAARTIVSNNKKILMIDFNDKQKQDINKLNNYDSARINESNYLNLTNSFKEKSKIITKNFSLIACLQKGGLSNIWGGGFYLDKEYVDRNKIDINFDFFKEKFNIKKYSKLISKRECKNYFQKYLIENTLDSNIGFYYPNYLLNKNNNSYYDTNQDLKNLMEKKNFQYNDESFLIDFTKLNGVFYLNTTNFKKNSIFRAKKIILSAGTIASTNILVKYKKKFNKKIRIYHNPQLAIIFFLNKKIKNDNYNKLLGELIYKIKLSDHSKVVGTIGRINKQTINQISDKFKFVPSFFIKFIFYLLRDRVVIGNSFLPNNLSSTFMTHDGDNCLIEGCRSNDYTNIKLEFIKKLKISIKKISLFTLIKEMPIGSDIHYTGSLVNKNDNETDNIDYRKLNKEQIFVIDGSIIPGNPIFPGGYIINQALKEGDKINKLSNEDI